MYLLARLCLLLIHTIYGLKNLLFSVIPSRSPKPLLARRRKLPTHISLILVPDPENHNAVAEKIVMRQCVERAVNWCQDLGIPMLTIYERDGSLNDLILSLSDNAHGKTTAGEFSNRLTPPSSDIDSSSEQLVKANPLGGVINTVQIPYVSKHIKEVNLLNVEKKVAKRKKDSLTSQRTQTLTLQLISREASKPALAEVTRTLIQRHARDAPEEKFTLTVERMNTMLEVESGFTPPDLLIVYMLYPSTAPLEIHGYPPWHTRLSEIHYKPRHGGILRGLLRLLSRKLDNPPHPITELDFRRALDEYSDAEFRLGK